MTFSEKRKSDSALGRTMVLRMLRGQTLCLVLLIGRARADSGGDDHARNRRRCVLRAVRGAWREMVPVERIELPTFGLQNRCSTAELNRLTAIDPIGVGSIAADRIRVPHDGSVYGRGPGRVNRRIAVKPLSGRHVAIRLSDHPVRCGHWGNFGKP
jgi:hypothetical protein